MDDKQRKFSENGALLMKWGQCGSSNAQFHGPTAVAVAPGIGSQRDKVYGADTGNNRIQVFILKDIPLTQLNPKSPSR